MEFLQIIGYILVFVLLLLTVTSLWHIPYSYYKEFQKEWKKEKFFEKNAELRIYVRSIDSVDKNKINQFLSNMSFKLFSIPYHQLDDEKQLEKMKDYIYENYDPQSREDKIDQLLK
jgi:hypothetical protein